jgi:hypothetical protein
MTLSIRYSLLWLATWPYFWTLRTYIILPMNRISQNQSNHIILMQEFGSFKNGKCHELNFINIAVSHLSHGQYERVLNVDVHLEHYVGRCDYRCILMAINHRSTLVCSGTVVWKSHNGHICHHHLGTAVCTTEISASVYGHSSKRGGIEIHVALRYTTSPGVNVADGNFLLPKERKG